MLVRTCPHWWGVFEVGVPDEGQEPVIGNVESSELRRGGGGGGGVVFLLLGFPVGALLALALVAFMLGWALGDRLVTLGGYHNRLRSGPDVIFQRREYILPTVQLLHSYWRVQG